MQFPAQTEHDAFSFGKTTDGLPSALPDSGEPSGALRIGSDRCAKRTERRIQGRSQNPRQGAQQNSTWPAPLGGALVQALPLLFKSRTAQVGGFLRSSS
jgi:hypothetical protein